MFSIPRVGKSVDLLEDADGRDEVDYNFMSHDNFADNDYNDDDDDVVRTS